MIPSASSRSRWFNRHARAVAVSVHDATAVGEARRMAAVMASELQFSPTAAGRVAIVVTEAATNVVKHGGPAGGQIILQHGVEPDVLEILALDKGRGMDVQRCLRDGYSTSGTCGTGLGALQRNANEFHAFSLPEKGTALLCRMRSEEPGSTPGLKAGPLLAGGVSVPKPGETVCGDAWAFHQQPQRAWVMIADGLGHGPNAQEAAQEAVRVFRDAMALVSGGIVAGGGTSVEHILRGIHEPLRKTRGAAVSIAEIDLARSAVNFAGVGNVAGVLLSPDGASRSMISHNGTLGAEARKFQQFTYPWAAGAALVLYSDGLLSQLRLEKYPGLLPQHPTLAAGVIYRDFVRGRDDATAVMVSDSHHSP